jgi:hypothetical protein
MADPTAPRTFEEMIDMAYASARKVALARQLKYGPYNIPKFGVKGILVRIYDKIERAVFFYWNGAPKPEDEGDEDPFIDLANYSLFALCVMRGWWTPTQCPPLAVRTGELLPRPVGGFISPKSEGC